MVVNERKFWVKIFCSAGGGGLVVWVQLSWGDYMYLGRSAETGSFDTPCRCGPYGER